MSAIETFQTKLSLERELYSLHLLAWSENPKGTPLTFEQYLAERRREDDVNDV